MTCFYFSSLAKLKIRRGGVVDDIFPPPPISPTAPVTEITVLQVPEAMVSISSTTPLAPGIIEEVSSVPLPIGPLSPLEIFRRPDKRKAVVDGEGETAVPRRGTDGDRDVRYSWRARQGREVSSQGAEGRDKLDPAILKKLQAPSAIATTSVHKYWTSAFAKAVDNAKLMELLKLAEMYISQSHLLNCELYQVLAMKVDEIRSTVGRDEDIDALHLENKDLREQLAFSEDARVRAIYDITKAGTIQMACVQAQRTAESQLRAC
ncbi:hypothetical protein Fot_06809 [Forsythia ovata]|uniref:Uncharacterized protein n=1 Tax=Forsythia ovata TaxID=205694 RepID=A0ABD1WY45_9LAMI